jgi:anti-anti-sigma regulatory factor
MTALPNDVTKKKPAEQSAEQRAARSVLFGDVSAHQPNAEIRLSGELAADTVADLGAQLAALIRTGHRQLLVDGRGLSQVSPVCVAVFNRAATGLRPLGGQLILTGLSNADADRLRSAGLHDAIRLTRPRSGDPSVGGSQTCRSDPSAAIRPTTDPATEVRGGPHAEQLTQASCCTTTNVAPLIQMPNVCWDGDYQRLGHRQTLVGDASAAW